MTKQSFDSDTNLTKVIIRPLYFGLVVNILVPMGLLLFCYWLDQRNALHNQLGSGADDLFYLFLAFSAGQAGLAVWYRHRLSKQPMVSSLETFERDFSDSLLKQSRPVFLLIAGIALFGLIYFFLTARFTEAVTFMVLSFVVFQVVRPRYGYVEKLIEKQRALAESGCFRERQTG